MLSLNYTNPMAMQRRDPAQFVIPTTGLCHSAGRRKCWVGDWRGLMTTYTCVGSITRLGISNTRSMGVMPTRASTSDH
jgi:hypothetical protein